MIRKPDSNLSRRRLIGLLVVVALTGPSLAFNPMSVPLICIEPNNNMWTDNTRLSGGGYPWGGIRDIGGDVYDMWAYIEIDGTRKRFMGNEHGIPAVITQNSLTVNCTQTIYTFSDQSVNFTLTWTSPKLLNELDAVSRPVGYVTFDVVSTDGAGHDVQIGFNTSHGWAVGTAGQTSQSVDFGTVGATTVSRHMIVGHDEVDPVRWLGTTLRPWWNRSGNKTFAQTFTDAQAEYERLYIKCKEFDARAIADGMAAGDTCYADLLGQAYRQCFAKNKLVAFNETTPWFFSLEGSSGNLIQTVDVVHPQAPLFLAYNQNTLKMFLDPIFYLYETGHCDQSDPPPHDLGQWPTVTGCGIGYMVEEASNMLLMSAAICHLDQSGEYARTHWTMLSKWTDWLLRNGLDPEPQNSTDDFSGGYGHSCGLAIKAVLGIGSYVKMANMLGESQTAADYRAILDTAVAGVIERGYDAAGHFRKANDLPGTWSQKYNLAWDRPLGLSVFADSILDNEMELYLENLNRYGVPLLSGVTYTKSDWELWSATITGRRSDFLALMHGEWNYTNENTNMCCGICDWHGTTGFDENNFGARGVCGGFFMKILVDKCLALQGASPSVLPPKTPAMSSRASTVSSAGVTFRCSPGHYRIVVADVSGRVVRQIAAQANGENLQVKLPDLPNGQYTVFAFGESGQSRSVRLCKMR